jgi:hypothetical protein
MPLDEFFAQTEFQIESDIVNLYDAVFLSRLQVSADNLHQPKRPVPHPFRGLIAKRVAISDI